MREFFGTNSITVKIYLTDADRTADTNVHRTSTVSNIDAVRIQALGAFVRRNTAGSNLKIYKFGGTVADWYGHEKLVTFNSIDFGSTPQYILFNTLSQTTSGAVAYQYRTQAVDGVWGDWSCVHRYDQLAFVTPVLSYEFQIRAVFNYCGKVDEASLTSFSVNSDTVLPSGLPTPSITATDAETGDELNFVVSGSQAGVTNHIYAREVGEATSYIELTSRVSDGSASATDLNLWSKYDGFAISELSGDYSLPGFFAPVRVTNGLSITGSTFKLAERICTVLSNDPTVDAFVNGEIYPGGEVPKSKLDTYPRVLYTITDNIPTEKKFNSNEYYLYGDSSVLIQAWYDRDRSNVKALAYSLIVACRRALIPANLSAADFQCKRVQLISETPAIYSDNAATANLTLNVRWAVSVGNDF